MLIVLASAALLFAQATPAAADPPAAPAEAAKPAAPEKPKMICTRETALGSNMVKRVCRTPEQVAADRANAQIRSQANTDRLQGCQGGAIC